MDLADFYGSGVSAFARQWLLLSHREPYSRGHAKLFARIGGSASGGGDLWRVDIEEGVPDAIIDRTWTVTVESGGGLVGGICEQDVLDCLTHNSDEPQKLEKIAIWCNADKKNVKRVLSHLMRTNKITVISDKYTLTGEQGSEF